MNHGALVVAVLAHSLAGFGQAPTEQNWNQLWGRIVPAAREMAWLDLDWNVTLWDAVQKSKAVDKPILLYAMNGHPLGCT